jgi:hypothetical protein
MKASNMNQIDIMYLRKSREDAELEKYGEGETLTRHYNILCELAKRNNIVVSDEYIFREVVSGESIDARPEIQKVLRLVESGIVRNVLVVEIERLARGDTSDQGRIAKTFKYSHTKIITPMKIYDPDNEYDNEYFEFGLFMSRREYLTINRRLNNGKYSSTKEGKFIGSAAPYGYDRLKVENGKGYTLVPNENAKYIKMIYEWVLQGNGAIHIAKMLQDIGAPTTTGANWSSATVRNILQNKTYCGYVSWQRRKTTKSLEDGITKKTRIRNDKAAEYFKGLHEPIIDEETWLKVQEMRERRALPSCNDNKNGLTNPLAGIVKCGYCGRTMQINTHKNKRIRMRCPNLQCACGSIYIDSVEIELISQLKDWLNGYSATVGKETRTTSRTNSVKDMIANLTSELDKISVQMNKACDMLELGVYDKDMFISRSQTLKNRQAEIKEKLSELKTELETINATDSQIQSLPKVQKILDNYFSYDTKTKNMLLKEILDHAVFTKEKGTSLVKDDSFDLEIFPILPRK